MHVVNLKLTEIHADPATNIRRSSEADPELVDSVRAQGVVEPVLVRESDHRLVVGFRRVDAAKKAGLEEVPVVLGSWTDQEAMELQLVENIQRANLDPVEEAGAVRRYLEAHPEVKQGALAKRLGKSQPWIANRVRMLDLPPAVLEAVGNGTLTPKHAERLLTVRDPEAQAQVAVDAVRNNWTVKYMDEALAGVRKGESAFTTATVKTCPVCNAEMTLKDFIRESGQWQFSAKRLQCPRCYSTWDGMTGKVSFNAKKEREASGGHGSAMSEGERERAQKERDRRVREAKATQEVIPFYRSEWTAREWLEAFVRELTEQQVAAITFHRGDDRLDPNWVEVRLQRGAVPFSGQLVDHAYTTGHRAEVFADPAVAERYPYYGVRDKDAVEESLERAHKWEAKAMGKARRRVVTEPEGIDATLLEADVQKIAEALLHGDLSLEELEDLRVAEVAGKNRTGVIEALDQAIVGEGKFDPWGGADLDTHGHPREE